MSNIWFTADLHLSHSNIIKYCNRPYANVEVMNAALINNWNSVVMPNDTIYNLGDFTFSNKAASFLSRLNGIKHLIKGNHDKQPSPSQGWASVNDYREIRIEGQIIILMHYAMRSWNKSTHGSWQLYGHSHGLLADDPNLLAIDVGVDCHNYHPISFDDVRRIMAKKTWKPRDNRNQ